MPGMSPNYQARTFDFSEVPQITGTVTPPIEVQSVEVAPPPTRTRRGGRHAAYCASLAFPAAFAIMAAAFGDLRLCAILCMMTLFMAVVGLLTLE